MSKADRQKWQDRYREGAYAERTHPSDYLVVTWPTIHNPKANKALDIACGAGRNALYLAARGYQVDAVDIAGEALRRGRETAEAASLDGPLEDIRWIEQDLDEGINPELDGYGLIIMMRYLDIPLLRSAAAQLVPGGYMLSEVHLQTDKPAAGPSNTAFRAVPGELKTAASGLEIIEYAEGLFTDPDGSTVALARLLAKKAS